MPYAASARPHRMHQYLTRIAAALVLSASLLGPLPALAQTQVDTAVPTLLPDPNTSYAFVIEDITSGARIGLNDTAALPSASLYKLAVAFAVMRQTDAGALHLDSQIPIVA